MYHYAIGCRRLNSFSFPWSRFSTRYVEIFACIFFCARKKIKLLKIISIRASSKRGSGRAKERSRICLLSKLSGNNAREYRFVPMPHDVNTLPTTIQR